MTKPLKLTAAQRTARVLRNNLGSRFSTPIARELHGINTVRLLDKDKTHALKKASI